MLRDQAFMDIVDPYCIGKAENKWYNNPDVINYSTAELQPLYEPDHAVLSTPLPVELSALIPPTLGRV